jgi:predicted transcriptional regulator
MKNRTLKNYIDEQMKDPGFKTAWHELDTEFELMESMIKARKKAGLTQEELARKIGTKQPALSRLESGAFNKATVGTLKSIAEALNANLVIKLETKRS